MKINNYKKGIMIKKLNILTVYHYVFTEKNPYLVFMYINKYFIR